VSLQFTGNDVLVVSPHFDDVPLSLGQSLTDGDLSRARQVRVRVVFGRTNWTTKVHPTRGRAPLISAWRRGEELLAAAYFGYTVRVQALEEVILRSGSMDPVSFRGSETLEDHPLVDRVTAMIRIWSDLADILLLPAGLGRHADHRIVAAAGARAVRAGLGTIAFYEDRPYTAYMDDADIAAELAELGLELEAQDVSGPIEEKTHRAVRRIYRSQMCAYFTDAQERDREAVRTERIWVP
jgi:LmbE family N-acetylglucosaminyl deacetylase